MSLIPSSTDESETERDGLFSTLREFHAAIVGLAVGVVVGLTGHYELAALFVFIALGAKFGSVKYLSDVRREPWYALGLFLVGLGIVRGLQTVALG
ncbi:hypothetical protein [Halosimplex pelagicum]|uniref:Uncharacterized protein n=1 Tax=Halosimplex pelagicum TaxID=869886 RepID=A0A7D5TA24_9EURY|nr:hypothetical protein [Halosimplex pelagicum]QLH80969.1 hypothetical protein HZS54_04660 [Halosimplex pelagicum]